MWVLILTYQLRVSQKMLGAYSQRYLNESQEP